MVASKKSSRLRLSGVLSQEKPATQIPPGPWTRSPGGRARVAFAGLGVRHPPDLPALAVVRRHDHRLVRRAPLVRQDGDAVRVDLDVAGEAAALGGGGRR